MKMSQLAMLKKENKLRARYLTENDRKAIKKMQIYMSASKVGEFDKEVIYKELIGIALVAQKNGESLGSELTDDYKAMCDGLVESAGKATTKERNLVLGRYISGIIFIYSLMNLTASVWLKNTLIMDFNIVDLFLYGVYPFFVLVMRNIEGKNIFSPQWSNILMRLPLVAIILTMIWFNDSPWSFTLFNMNTILLAIITGTIFTYFQIAYYKYMEKQATLVHWADGV